MIFFFFFTWLILTFIVNVTTKNDYAFLKYDLFMLIPRWNFFAPFPLKNNINLVYRNQTSKGCMTCWKNAIPEINRTQNGLNLINSKRRIFKSIIDVQTQLKMYLHSKVDIRLCPSYLFLKNIVNHCPHHPDTIAIQFAIIEWNEEGYEEIFLLSDLYKLIK